MQSSYKGRLVRLAPLDHEHDPQIIADWMHDPLMRSILVDAARPLSVESVRKLLEKVEKQMEDAKNIFHFTVRTLADDRLVGLASIFWIDFHNGTGVIKLAIGGETARGHGFGSEALGLLLNFAFNDLNLHRLSAWTGADNPSFIHMIEKAGFKLEATQREALFHAGSYWDMLLYGLLRKEWEAGQ